MAAGSGSCPSCAAHPGIKKTRVHAKAILGTVAPFFQTIEVETLQRAICGALDIDPAWALQDFELTPYKFHLLGAVAVRMGDIDAGLCDTLKVGAPTGVKERIPPSGVWPPLLQAEEGGGVEEGHPTMLCCDQNHASAERLRSTLLRALSGEQTAVRSAL